MALPHARPLDVIDLKPGTGSTATPPGLPDGPGVSRSILKTNQLQLLRLVLHAGHDIPDHAMPGEILVQCLSGEVDVVTRNEWSRLVAAQLVVVPAGESHKVHAHRDSVLIMTVVRTPGNDERHG